MRLRHIVTLLFSLLLAGVNISPAAASGGWSYVGVAGSAIQKHGGALTITVSQSVPAGDLVVVYAAANTTGQSNPFDMTSPTNVTDSKHNAWGGASPNVQGVGGYAFSVLTTALVPGDTISISAGSVPTGMQSAAGVALEFSGKASTSAEATASTGDTLGSTSIYVGPAALTSGGSDLLVGFAATNGPEHDTFKPGDDGNGHAYTLPAGGRVGTSGQNPSTNISVAVCYVAAVGPEQPSFNASITSRPWNGLVVALS